jgi:hypothetical protein
MQIRFEMCVCTLFNANLVMEGVGAHALKGKNNFTVSLSVWVLLYYFVCLIKIKKNPCVALDGASCSVLNVFVSFCRTHGPQERRVYA